MVTDGELALMVDHQRRDAALDVRHRRQRHLRVAGARDIDVAEVGRIALILRSTSRITRYWLRCV